MSNNVSTYDRHSKFVQCFLGPLKSAETHKRDFKYCLVISLVAAIVAALGVFFLLVNKNQNIASTLKLDHLYNSPLGGRLVKGFLISGSISTFVFGLVTLQNAILWHDAVKDRKA